ncbi:hypothetical protein [Streptomyces sp. NPDC050546]|uniref:hypothetical protein n=1 Tax=Streptomyces sp. NPDC050546 TaxID=3365628 RepID=UPI0037A21C4A
MPERFGPWKTVHKRHLLWSADGTWDRLLRHIQSAADADPFKGARRRSLRRLSPRAMPHASLEGVALREKLSAGPAAA